MSDNQLQDLANDLHAAARGIAKAAGHVVASAALSAERVAKTKFDGTGVAVVFRGQDSVSLISAKRFGVVTDDGSSPPGADIDTAAVASGLANVGAKLITNKVGL